MIRYLIENVDIWTPVGAHLNQSVLVENGKLLDRCESSEKSFRNGAQTQVYCGKGKVLIPSGVDCQVHLRVPGQLHKETPITGLRAALAGGITTVLTMPNTDPVIDSVSICELANAQLKEAIQETGVDVYFTSAMTQGLRGQVCVDFESLMAWGVRAFTDDGLGVQSQEVMEQVFQKSHELGFQILQHAEILGHGAALAAGPVQEKLGLTPYPESAEVEMVKRDLALLEKYPNAKYHVLHISSAETARLVGEAKFKGLNATGEVSPHHLYFSAEDIQEEQKSFKMNPPLRSQADQKKLLKYLQEGVIDFVATDHAPHEPQAKDQEFDQAAYGTTGLETFLRTLLTLHAQGALSTERLVQVFASRPAEFLGVPNQYCHFEVGNPFRAVLVSLPNKPQPVGVSDLQSLSKNNCFLNCALSGKIEKVFNETILWGPASPEAS